MIGVCLPMKYGRQKKKLQNMAQEINLKRKINGKLFYTTENIINDYGYRL